MSSNELELVVLAGARSEMWKNFRFKVNEKGDILNKKEVVCRFCHHCIKYNGNTKNLNPHLYHCTKEPSKSSKFSFKSSFFGITTSKLSKNSKRHKDLTNGLLNFIVKDLRPFALVEGEGFCECMKLASPEYDVPSSATITRLCTSVTTKEKDNLKNYLQNVSFVCLTLHFWTSRVNTSYLGVTCHFILDWKLHSRVL